MKAVMGALEGLGEVAQRHRARRIAPDVARFSMDQAVEARWRLRDGQLYARAYIVPSS